MLMHSLHYMLRQCYPEDWSTEQLPENHAELGRRTDSRSLTHPDLSDHSDSISDV